MLLRDFLDKEGIMYKDFADDLGINHIYFYTLLSGRRKFTRALAKKVEILSKGRVSRVEALYPEDFQEEKGGGTQMRFNNMPKNEDV